VKPTPFREGIDLEPIPFGQRHCLAAKRLKKEGLIWNPQVGCFVWDEAGIIEAPSPFPHRIYFVLNLGHFARRFGTMEDVADKLVWLPTWHQARLLCKTMGISKEEICEAVCTSGVATVDGELLSLYGLILKGLEKQRGKEVDVKVEKSV
jgi:hypothetical protein